MPAAGMPTLPRQLELGLRAALPWLSLQTALKSFSISMILIGSYLVIIPEDFTPLEHTFPDLRSEECHGAMCVRWFQI